MTETTRGLVLLTGVSGFIGLHCAKEMLQQGYSVRGSVRSKEKEDEVLATLHAASVDTTHLSFVRLDLTSDNGWAQAAEGCDYIMHVASPFTIANPKTEDEMITPAVQGSIRALKAGESAGVKRVVLTSSILSMMGSMKTGTFGPEDWTDTQSKTINTYTKSKALAERAAWEFMASQSDKNKMELVVVNPGAVFGPSLGKNMTGQTMTLFKQMLQGKIPLVPNFAFPMVDVRDVAKIHVEALTNTEANGKRIIVATAEAHSFLEIAQILKNEGYKGPSTRKAPDFLLRITSIFDREAKGMLGMLGMNIQANNTETRTLFNWTPRTMKESVLDTAKSIKAIQ
ncbi:NAD-dependent epimerase [Enterovibrio norvegicus FF-33]|uniref:NAD-dependent epimerase n=1 Tax=Enterovibrio norvegicus FF-454 TaxID=1185651 RepID=A0A1E5C0W8_9GAMM|nr:aldehyde reductase [Enterovibrio norvegicus]OEE59129.1 NAD-dependent epimerase [Enterovibrio norvegicus FF-454]OEE67715.1 NAD-dependent epimerase [Enterovibrio norvegicus FF-33]OEE76348.1 NAD-dependent epimerase [Enterovibrio norvegicus FF-162]